MEDEINIMTEEMQTEFKVRDEIMYCVRAHSVEHPETCEDCPLRQYWSEEDHWMHGMDAETCWAETENEILFHIKHDRLYMRKYRMFRRRFKRFYKVIGEIRDALTSGDPEQMSVVNIINIVTQRLENAKGANDSVDEETMKVQEELLDFRANAEQFQDECAKFENSEEVLTLFKEKMGDLLEADKEDARTWPGRF